MSAIDGSSASVAATRAGTGENVAPASAQALASRSIPVKKEIAAPSSASPAVRDPVAKVAEYLERKVEESREVEDVVARANDRFAADNRSIRFRPVTDSDVMQIQIFDSEKGKVIRSIPTDEMIRLSARMRELSGIGAMVDESR